MSARFGGWPAVSTFAGHVPSIGDRSWHCLFCKGMVSALGEVGSIRPEVPTTAGGHAVAARLVALGGPPIKCK